MMMALPPTNTENVIETLQNFDTLLSLVDGLRAHLHQSFELLSELVFMNPDEIERVKEVLSTNFKKVQTNMKDITRVGAKLQSHLVESSVFDVEPKSAVNTVQEEPSPQNVSLNLHKQLRLRKRVRDQIDYTNQKFRKELEKKNFRFGARGKYSTKRLKTPESIGSNNFSQLDSTVAQLAKETHLEITKITSNDDLENIIGLKVKCPSVFTAIISFKQFYPNDKILVERVNMFGPLEEEPDMWKVSSLPVFKKLTDTSNQMLYTTKNRYPNDTLQRIIKWLAHNHKAMFSEKWYINHLFGQVEFHSNISENTVNTPQE